MGRLLTISLFMLVTLPALARDDGDWSWQPPEIRAWFQSVTIPPTNNTSCCGEGDAVDVELIGDNPDDSIEVRVLHGHGFVYDGVLFTVPRRIIQTKYGNPIDRYILFLTRSFVPICFIPKIGA